METELRVASEDVLGESVFWSADRGCVFWVDGMGPKIHRLDMRTGQTFTFIPPVELPLGMIAETSDALDTLFITTARYGMDSAALKKSPLAGNLFSVVPGVKGIASTPLMLGS